MPNEMQFSMHQIESSVERRVQVLWFGTGPLVLPLLNAHTRYAATYHTLSPSLQVGVTGSYAGVGVQYVAPSLLVMFARREACRSLGPDPNPYASPFRHPAWPIAALLWAAGCVAVVTANLATRLAKGT